MAVQASDVERRGAVLRRLVDGGAGADEQLRALDVADLAGDVERRKAVLRRLVDGGAGGDAMPHLHGGACEHGVVQSRGLERTHQSVLCLCDARRQNRMIKT